MLLWQLPLLSPSLWVYYSSESITNTNKQTSCWCEELHHINISRTWILHFAATTHMLKIHKASGNASWPITGAFLDACRGPWSKICTEVYPHAVMTICATSRTRNTQRVRRYSDCLTWPCMAHRYTGAMCLIASWNVGLSGIHLICTNIFRE